MNSPFRENTCPCCLQPSAADSSWQQKGMERACSILKSTFVTAIVYSCLPDVPFQILPLQASPCALCVHLARAFSAPILEQLWLRDAVVSKTGISLPEMESENPCLQFIRIWKLWGLSGKDRSLGIRAHYEYIYKTNKNISYEN